MAKKRQKDRELGAREREILDVVFRLKKASVADVQSNLDKAPSYSAVRTMLGILETKGFLKRKRDGVRHHYLPADSPDVAGRSALAHLMSTFFEGSASKTFAALLDKSVANLTDEELDQLQSDIDKARQEDR